MKKQRNIISKANAVVRRFNAFRAVHPTRVLVIGVVFGVLLGVGGTLALTRDDATKDHTPAAGHQVRKQIQDQDDFKSSRIDKAYERAKARVAEDVAIEVLTKQEADVVYEKLKEIYEYRKQSQGKTKEERTELRKKQIEWRAWAKEQNTSSRYYSPLY